MNQTPRYQQLFFMSAFFFVMSFLCIGAAILLREHVERSVFYGMMGLSFSSVGGFAGMSGRLFREYKNQIEELRAEVQDLRGSVALEPVATQAN